MPSIGDTAILTKYCNRFQLLRITTEGNKPETFISIIPHSFTGNLQGYLIMGTWLFIFRNTWTEIKILIHRFANKV